MKKDVMYIVGGLAVGAVVFYAFKDKILKKKRNGGMMAEMPTTIDDVDSGAAHAGWKHGTTCVEAPPASQGALPRMRLP